MNDLKFAFRQLLKNPGFTAVAVLSLALGIGANTAIFSVVNAILLRPLPFKDPERLAMVFERGPSGSQKGSVSAPLLGGWREQTTVFEGLAARGFGGFILTGKGQPENITGSRLSANIFSLLGIKPMLGRDFLPEEETIGKDHVVLLSYEFWQRRLAGDPNTVGQIITLNDEPFTVIGVMPPRTFFPERDTQLWTPLAFSPDQLRDRGSHNYLVYGRLKPGITLTKAQAEMDLIAPRVDDADHQGWTAHIFSLQEVIVGDSRAVLLFLLGSVGLVLLIGCANIANLLLARSAARTREFAIRAALGARRRQIIGQLLNESLLLAGLGGLAGTLIAFLGLKGLIHFSPPDLPRIWEGIELDGWTLAFTAIVTLTAGVLFGLAPVLQSSSPALIVELNESSRGSSAGRQRQRFRSALVVSEVAVSVMLLIGAGLMIRSFSRLLSQQLGYNPEHLISMDLGLPWKKYPAQTDKVRFFEQLLTRVQSLPGIQSAALVRNLPLSGQNTTMSVSIHGAPPLATGEANDADYAQVSPGYFRTMDTIDKDQPIDNVRTMTELVASSVGQRRLSVQLLAGFSGVALLLAAIGLYGVLAYNVTQRRQEIGIRMALGAQRWDVLSLVVGHGMRLTLMGVGIGTVAALALTRAINSLLYEVKPTDPITLGGVCLLLSGVAMLACWLPARRAAKIDPMEALRYE